MSKIETVKESSKQLLSKYYNAINKSNESNNKLKKFVELALTPKVILHPKKIDEFFNLFNELYSNSYFLVNDNHGMNIAFRFAEQMDIIEDDGDKFVYVEIVERMFTYNPFPYLVRENPLVELKEVLINQLNTRIGDANKNHEDLIILMSFIVNFENLLVFLATMIRKLNVEEKVLPSIIDYYQKVEKINEHKRLLTKEEVLPIM